MPISVLSCTGIENYGYTDQRKIEVDLEVTQNRTGYLLPWKPRTSQLSHANYSMTLLTQNNLSVISVYL